MKEKETKNKNFHTQNPNELNESENDGNLLMLFNNLFYFSV